jgi:hypothetical protein
MRLIIQANMKVMKLSAEDNITFYVLGLPLSVRANIFRRWFEGFILGLRRVVDVCFDVSEERTASALTVTKTGSGGSWSFWEEIEVSIIWQSLRNRLGNLKTCSFNGHSNIEYAFRFFYVFRIHSPFLRLRKFFGEYFLMYKFVIISYGQIIWK